VLLALALLGRVRRDFPLVLATGLTGFLVWPSVASSAFTPLGSDTWGAARHAGWLDLEHGLVSGTFGALSALCVQLFHALTPITGTGELGARTASMLVGVFAVVAIYALARRVAGVVGAITAVALALICDPFRQSLSSGDATGTLVLASCLFLLALHHVLTRRDLRSFGWLGASGGVATIADPTWWPGVVAALLLIALLYSAAGDRRRAVAVAVAVFAIVVLPARVSVAHQAGGDLTADVTLRTTYARNAEFLGRDHGAPPNRVALNAAPYSGQRVGLGSYVFGDHSLSLIVGGTLSGAYDAIGAAGARPVTMAVGLVAFIIGLAGLVILLFLPRLRLFVIVPALLAAVQFFLSNRAHRPLFIACAPFWPALLVGGATVAYIAWHAAEPRLRQSAFVSALATRANAALWRARRTPDRI
jgi:Dolichyl-phosphate-mannose-protein mannosyltransferase